LTLLDPNNPQPNSAYETVVNSLAHPHLEAGQQVVGGRGLQARDRRFM
jgi:hypothetical protein